jgi:hypothetical protein
LTSRDSPGGHSGLRPANKKRRGNSPAAQAASIIDTMSWRLPERDESSQGGLEPKA